MKEIAKFLTSSSTCNCLQVLSSCLCQEKLPLYVELENGSYTDFRSIHLGFGGSLEKFKQEGILETKEEFYSVLRGLNAHESEHIASSDAGCMDNAIKRYQKRLGGNKQFAAFLGKSVINIIEDGRIERLAKKKAKGVEKDIVLMNLAFNAISPPINVDENPIGAYFRVLLSLSTMGKFPDDWQSYEVESKEIFDLGNKSSQIVRKGVSGGKCKDALNATIEILDLAEDFFKKYAPENFQDDSEGGNQESGSNSDSGQKDGGGSGKGSQGQEQKASDIFIISTGYEMGKDGNDKKSQNSSGGNGEEDKPDSDSNGDKKNCSSCESLKEAKDQANQRHSNEVKCLEAREASRAKKKQQEMSRVGMTVMEINDELHNKSSLTIKDLSHRNGDAPDYVKTQASKLKKSLEFILREETARDNCRKKSGMIDKKSYVRFVARGEDDIFRRRSLDVDRDIVGLAVFDISGSMRGSKISHAIDAINIIEHGVGSLIPLKMFAYNVEQTIQHSVVKHFDKSRKGYVPYSAIYPSGCNCDSLAVAVGTKELLNRPEKKKFLFVITDGLPSAHFERNNGYEDAEEQLQEVVKEAKKQGIKIIPIAIDAHGQEKKFNYLYGENVVMVEPNQLAGFLSKTFIKLYKN